MQEEKKSSQADEKILEQFTAEMKYLQSVVDSLISFVRSTKMDKKKFDKYHEIIDVATEALLNCKFGNGKCTEEHQCSIIDQLNATRKMSKKEISDQTHRAMAKMK